MPTISVFYGIVIQLFWRDQAPPHFHALYAEHEAVIELRDFRDIRGSLPERAMTLVLEWATEHRDELMENWNLCSQLKNPQSNRTPEVESPILHTVPWRVTSVTAVEDSRLRVAFVDGVIGDVDMRSFLSDSRIDNTIFEPLRDRQSLLKPELCWERFSGRTAPISLPMRCMTPFANTVFGLWIEAVRATAKTQGSNNSGSVTKSQLTVGKS